MSEFLNSQVLELPDLSEGQLPLLSTFDNDEYNFPMSKLIKDLYPDVRARYELIVRDPIPLPKGYVAALQYWLGEMANLRGTEAQAQLLLDQHPYLTESFIQWFLEDFRFKPEQGKISTEFGQLKAEFEGPWHEAVFWETPFMSLVVSLFNHMADRIPEDNWQEKNAIPQFEIAQETHELLGWLLAEFGTRRRFNLRVQAEVLLLLAEHAPGAFLGSSNPALVSWLKEHGIDVKSIGTWAHQLVMGHAAIHGFENANRATLDSLDTVFGDKLPVVLTDTYTNELFFNILDTMDWDRIKTFRHDSGDAYDYVDYVASQIIATSRDVGAYNILFSDGLTIEKARDLANYALKAGFGRADAGIGTSLSHNLTGHKGLNIAFKPTEFLIPGKGWIGTAKLSEVAGKGSGLGLETALKVLNLEIVGQGREAHYQKVGV